MKKIVLVLDGKEIAARVAWALVEDVPLLLGRVDIFSQFRIIFDERKGWIDFKSYDARKRKRANGIAQPKPRRER